METRKEAAIIREVHEYSHDPITDQDILRFVYADWPEGRAHTDWLETASVEEIADWVIAGLR